MAGLLPIGRPSAGNGGTPRSSPSSKGAPTLASACRATRSSPPRGLVETPARLTTDVGGPSSALRSTGGSRAIRTFDRVIANPPFSLKEWGHTVWSNGDPYGRDKYGTPPKSYGDLAFVQHMLASLREDGKLAVVVPHGLLFRAGAEGAIRRAFIENDLIEGIIGLAPNLFYGAGIPAAILFMRKNKPAKMQRRVMIVNGAEQFDEGRAQNYLRNNHIDTLTVAYSGMAAIERLATVVSLDEIAANDFNLNITRYVNFGEEDEVVNVSVEAEKLSALIVERDAAEAKINALLQELGYAG